MPEFELVVKAKEFVADGVVRLVLVDPGGADLPEWTAGAHLDVVLSADLVRQYSLCGDVADRGRYEIAVLREDGGRGGSRHVHDRLAEGDRVRVAGPRNNFPLEPAPRHLFIAGGVGITPILPMLAVADSDWRLLYGGRTRGSMAFLRELLDRWGDGDSGGRVTVRPADEFGLLDLAGALDAVAPETVVHCCGPEPLLAAVEELCGARGLALHVERFAPKPQEPGADEAFEVELASDGRVVAIPADRSVLDALLDAGLRMAFSCTEGTCGTCEVAVLAGEPDHRDSLLSEIERTQNKSMFVCVSRSRTPRLRLDI